MPQGLDSSGLFPSRAYASVLEGLLEGIDKDLAYAAHTFRRATEEYELGKSRGPVPGIHRVTGIVTGGVSREFVQKVDYVFAPPDAQHPARIVWLVEKGTLPREGTEFLVAYFVRRRRSRFLDLMTGGVVRKLAEAAAAEIARLYGRLRLVYESAFVETAEGNSLDLAASMLGLARRTADHATAEVEFERAEGTPGSVYIPAGTRVTTPNGAVTFESSDARALDVQAHRIDVPMRAIDPGPSGLVAANALSVLDEPIAGIGRVTNPRPAQGGAEEETDDELRARARTYLERLQRCVRRC